MTEPEVEEEYVRTIDEAAATLRGVIREAHAATKDLRKATAEAKEIAETGARRAVRQILAEEVKQGWVEYAEQVAVAMEKATDAVYERFDTIFGVLVGRRKPTDLPTVVQQKIEAGEIDVEDLLRRERSIRLRLSRTEGESWARIAEETTGE